MLYCIRSGRASSRSKSLSERAIGADVCMVFGAEAKFEREDDGGGEEDTDRAGDLDEDESRPDGSDIEAEDSGELHC